MILSILEYYCQISKLEKLFCQLSVIYFKEKLH